MRRHGYAIFLFLLFFFSFSFEKWHTHGDAPRDRILLSYRIKYWEPEICACFFFIKMMFPPWNLRLTIPGYNSIIK